MTTNQCILSITEGFSLILSQTTLGLMKFNAGCSHGAIRMAYDIGIIDANTFTELNDEMRKYMKMWHVENDVTKEISKEVV